MHIICVLCAAIAMIGADGLRKASHAAALVVAHRTTVRDSGAKCSHIKMVFRSARSVMQATRYIVTVPVRGYFPMSSPAISRTASVNSTVTDAPSVAPSSNALLGQATRQAQHGRLSGLNKVGSKLRQIGPALGKVGSKLSEVGLALGEANANCMSGCPPFLKTNRANWAPRQHRAHCKKAVAYAKNAAAKDTPWREAEYEKLSGKMCWDAVKYCAFSANIITEDEYDALNARWDLVTPHDTRIHNSDDLKNVPPGYALGFFRIEHFADNSASNVRRDPFHVMLNIDGNKAAGNKNDCVGFGERVGWEVLNLSKLKWYQGTVVAPKGGNVTVDPAHQDALRKFPEEIVARAKTVPVKKLKETDENYDKIVEAGVLLNRFVLLGLTHRPISKIGQAPTLAQSSNQASTSSQPQ